MQVDDLPILLWYLSGCTLPISLFYDSIVTNDLRGGCPCSYDYFNYDIMTR